MILGGRDLKRLTSFASKHVEFVLTGAHDYLAVRVGHAALTDGAYLGAVAPEGELMK